VKSFDYLLAKLISQLWQLKFFALVCLIFQQNRHDLKANQATNTTFAFKRHPHPEFSNATIVSRRHSHPELSDVTFTQLQRDNRVPMRTTFSLQRKEYIPASTISLIVHW